MKPGKFTHAVAVILSSITSLFAHGTPSKAEPAKTKFSKKSQRSADDRSFDVTSLAFTPGQLAKNAPESGQRFPWKREIVTTVFWVGEKPAGNNPMPNRTSSWDKEWTKNYGGFDDPDPARRSNYIPAKFTPRCFYLQRALDRYPQGKSSSLRAMGRCGSIPHRSLAIRVWQ